MQYVGVLVRTNKQEERRQRSKVTDLFNWVFFERWGERSGADQQGDRQAGRQEGALESICHEVDAELQVCRYASPLLPTLLPRPQVQMSVNGSRWGKKRRQRQTGEKHKATRLPTVRPWQFKELFNYVQLSSLNHFDKEPKTLFTFCAPNNQYPFVPLLCDMDKPSHHLMTFKRLYFFSVFTSQNSENLIWNRLASLAFCDFHLIEF